MAPPPSEDLSARAQGPVLVWRTMRKAKSPSVPRAGKEAASGLSSLSPSPPPPPRLRFADTFSLVHRPSADPGSFPQPERYTLLFPSPHTIRCTAQRMPPPTPTSSMPFVSPPQRASTNPLPLPLRCHGSSRVRAGRPSFADQEGEGCITQEALPGPCPSSKGPRDCFSLSVRIQC